MTNNSSLVELHLTDIEAATIDNLLTVHLSELPSDSNPEYIKILQDICTSIQVQLGVDKND